MNRSQTISGLILLAVGTLFSYAGAPLADGELETVILFVAKALQVGGFMWAYWGRIRQGDVKLFGGYKESI